MYSRPSSSVRRAPRPSRKNTGVPPTARKARTGEFTPPGKEALGSLKQLFAAFVHGSGPLRAIEESGEGARRGTHVGGVEERGDDGEHVGARGHHARRVLQGDAADRRHRQARSGARMREVLERGARRAGLVPEANTLPMPT
jgi:hypothetical protein